MYLNYIQLKVARCVLNLGVRDIGALIQTSRTTVSRLENNIVKLCDMKLADRRNIVLHEFFKKNGVIFPNEHVVTFCPSNNIIQKNNHSCILTRFQLRAARIIINKTQAELAKIATIHPSIIIYAENQANEDCINPKDSRVIPNLITIFQQYGVNFPSNFSIIFKN
jgi:DNA-binding XRE family transcriptional regulator